MKSENKISYMEGDGYSRSSKVTSTQTNQWSGHLNDGRTVNMGRGPTKGNDGTCGHAGYESSGKKPMTSSLPSSTKIKDPDYINGGAQYRGAGGTSVKKPSADAKINVGRGPTKGNQQ